MRVDKQVADLLTKYKKIFSEIAPPDWAVENRVSGEKICPSIPFVGKNYHLSKNKVLIYASAENLTYYEKDESKNDLLETEIAWNRRRYSIDLNPESIFPNVHISPVNNGGLLATVALLADWHNLLKMSPDPYEFIENLSIDNLGKYSIKTIGGPNKDYISSLSMLEHSFPYIGSDLDILKPDYILIPKKAYAVRSVEDLFIRKAPNAIIIPIYQLTSTVINCHIANKLSEEHMTEVKQKTPQYIKNWVDDIKGLKKDGM
nr:hypothetical protein [Candidatus Desulfobacula maris]